LQTPSRQRGAILDRCPIATPPFSAQPQVLEVTTTEGEPRILGYAYIQQSPFVFVVLMRPEDVMHGWLRLRNEILWLFGVSVVLIMAVILGSSTFLVNRIREADRRRDEALHSIEYTDKMASIGRMAAGVAHEINNPLAIISENAGLLKDLLSMRQQPPDRDRTLKIAEAVLRSVERCSTITHRLLGFAKRMEPLTERISLGPLLEEVLSFQRKEAECRNIAIGLSVPPDLPIIESDRGQLQQVFLNILSNAFAAVPRRGAHRHPPGAGKAGHGGRHHQRQRLRNPRRVYRADLRAVLQHQRRLRHGTGPLHHLGHRGEAGRPHRRAKRGRPGRRVYRALARSQANLNHGTLEHTPG